LPESKTENQLKIPMRGRSSSLESIPQNLLKGNKLERENSKSPRKIDITALNERKQVIKLILLNFRFWRDF
jgi:hypothetical protein